VGVWVWVGGCERSFARVCVACHATVLHELDELEQLHVALGFRFRVWDLGRY
jgi:hypothetical protein